MYSKGKNDIIVRFLGGFEFCLKLRFCFTSEKGSFVSVTRVILFPIFGTLGTGFRFTETLRAKVKEES